MGVSERTAELNTGAKIPLLGLGTGSASPNEEEIKAAVAAALQVGYRHFDTASAYGSEHALGEALNTAFRNGFVRREDVFVTTKLWCSEHDDPVAAIRNSLKNLQLEYVDLYLVHWPVKLAKGPPVFWPKENDFLPLDIKSVWKGMEQCVDMGFTRAIGLSNFSSKKIQDLLSYANIPPAVNQVEMHPLWQQKKLREFCSKHKIHVSAYSPLGAPNTAWGSNLVMYNSLIHEIAQKHGKTTSQVLLRWGIEKGVSVLPKSFNPGRMSENFHIFEWCLSAEDHDKIGKLEQGKLVRGEQFLNATTSPYKTLGQLWDGEI